MITIVTQAQLAVLPLGVVVGFRPGTTLVKFPSIPKTYEIDRNGLLRWITDESTALRLHGLHWNALVITESEANYNQYRFGSDISSAITYDPTAEEHTASSIELFVMR